MFSTVSHLAISKRVYGERVVKGVASLCVVEQADGGGLPSAYGLVDEVKLLLFRVRTLEEHVALVGNLDKLEARQIAPCCVSDGRGGGERRGRAYLSDGGGERRGGRAAGKGGGERRVGGC